MNALLRSDQERRNSILAGCYFDLLLLWPLVRKPGRRLELYVQLLGFIQIVAQHDRQLNLIALGQDFGWVMFDKERLKGAKLGFCRAQAAVGGRACHRHFPGRNVVGHREFELRPAGRIGDQFRLPYQGFGEIFAQSGGEGLLFSVDRPHAMGHRARHLALRGLQERGFCGHFDGCGSCANRQFNVHGGEVRRPYQNRIHQKSHKPRRTALQLVDSWRYIAKFIGTVRIRRGAIHGPEILIGCFDHCSGYDGPAGINNGPGDGARGPQTRHFAQRSSLAHRTIFLCRTVLCCRVLAAALRQDLAERRNFYLSIGTVFGAMARYLDPSHELGHGRDFVYRARLAVDRI